MKLPLFSDVLRSGFMIRPYSTYSTLRSWTNSRTVTFLTSRQTPTSKQSIGRSGDPYYQGSRWTVHQWGRASRGIGHTETYFSLHFCIIWWYFCSFPVSIIVWKNSWSLSLTDYLFLNSFQLQVWTFSVNYLINGFYHQFKPSTLHRHQPFNSMVTFRDVPWSPIKNPIFEQYR